MVTDLTEFFFQGPWNYGIDSSCESTAWDAARLRDSLMSSAGWCLHVVSGLVRSWPSPRTRPLVCPPQPPRRTTTTHHHAATTCNILAAHRQSPTNTGSRIRASLLDVHTDPVCCPDQTGKREPPSTQSRNKLATGLLPLSSPSNATEPRVCAACLGHRFRQVVVSQHMAHIKSPGRGRGDRSVPGRPVFPSKLKRLVLV